MRSSWLLFALCMLLVLAGCKKESNTPPPVIPPPVKVTGKLSIANVLQSNMVVQRDKPFKVWGTAEAAAKVTVNVSWNSSDFTAIADQSGNWSVIIPSAAANSDPQTIKIKDDSADTLLVKNILIGDVWICSGQSNMVYQVDSIPPFGGVTDYPAEIAAANFPLIRALTVQTDMEQNPVDNLMFPASWQVCSPQTVGQMSGVAYYFAQKLYTTLNNQ